MDLSTGQIECITVELAQAVETVGVKKTQDTALWVGVKEEKSPRGGGQIVSLVAEVLGAKS